MQIHKFSTLFLLLLSPLIAAKDFSVYSPNIEYDGTIIDEQIFNGFACQGENVSPEIIWKNVPKDAKSLAVTVYNPDAPANSRFWHWVVFNIPPQITSLWQGAGKPGSRLMPGKAIQSMTDFGQPGYGGPCPSIDNKRYRYEITVYALKVKSLPLNEKSPPTTVEYHLNQNLIDKAILVVNYGP